MSSARPVSAATAAVAAALQRWGVLPPYAPVMPENRLGFRRGTASPPDPLTDQPPQRRAHHAYSERWRSRFRRDADHFSAVLGMVIGIVGIVLLSRLHEARWANWRQTGLHWKVEDPSCRKKGCPCARSKKSLDFNPWGCHSAR